MAVDVTSQLFQDIIKDINANATDVPSAIQILESTKYNITNPQDVATYLAYSKLAPVSTTNPDGTPKTAKQPVSITTILGIPTGIASLAGMLGKPAALASIMPKIGTGFLAGLLQYEVFDRAEKATEESNLMNIALLGGLYFAAIFATMLFLAAMAKQPKVPTPTAPNTGVGVSTVFGGGGLNPYRVDVPAPPPVSQSVLVPSFGSEGVISTTYKSVAKKIDKLKRRFTIDYHDMPNFLLTLAVATAITTLVLGMGILIAKLGQDQAPQTAQASVVNAFLKQIPPMTSLLPQNALVFLTAGATALGSSFSLTPGNMSNQFNTPTVQLVQELGGTTQGGAAMLGKVLVQQGLGPNGADLVTLIYPGTGGNSSGITFALDTNGYIIGKNGPATSYLPFFQPVVDASGKVTGMKKNFGALQAILQIPACMTYANDTKMEARKRESALETCLRGNKDVKFIAMVGS